ncbi:MAG: serine/threonine-protein phosphatase [Magnetococcales bacterium]|nr:serine/threonine-protein phosphatase [Magnetococcales bacterium]
MVQHIADRLRVVGCSDVGLVRTLNEDSFRIDEELGLLVVADGMGGHDAGEVASAQVIDSIQESLNTFIAEKKDPPAARNQPAECDDDDEEPTLDDIPNPLVDTVSAAVNRANSSINNANWEKGYPEGMGMGTTVVGLWFPEFSETQVVFHVGDSRFYLYRQKRLLQVTQDHSMYQQWINFGGKGRPPAQNILLQAMGPAQKVRPDVRFQDLLKGDVVLLCSDGLSGMIDDKKIGEILSKVTADNLDASIDLLIKAAREAGGKDNITAILGFSVK